MIAGRHSMIAGKPLPFDSAVAWLEGASSTDDDGPYIDTGIKPSNNPILEVCAQPLDRTFSAVCGCRKFNAPGCYFYFAIQTSGYPRVTYGVSGTNRTVNVSIPTNAFTTFKQSRAGFWIDGVLRKSYSEAVGTQFSSGPSFALFNVLQTGGATTVGDGLTGRIAWCKVWNDDGATLVGDFVMVRKNGVGYAYNKVDGALLGATNGTLTIGPDTSYQQGGG